MKKYSRTKVDVSAFFHGLQECTSREIGLLTAIDR